MTGDGLFRDWRGLQECAHILFHRRIGRTELQQVTLGGTDNELGMGNTLGRIPRVMPAIRPIHHHSSSPYQSTVNHNQRRLMRARATRNAPVAHASATVAMIQAPRSGAKRAKTDRGIWAILRTP
jgi:hypothetical protein